MFGSTILDVAAGVVFAFLGISLAASAITEALNSFMNTRQTTLVQGVQALLNDPNFTGLARDLFNHALINPLSDGAATTVATLTAKPAYIDGGHFATALLDVIRQGAPGPSLDATINAVADPQIRQTLQALLIRAGGDEVALRTAMGDWFDSSMERVSGVYKRYTQAVAFSVALALAVLMNVDALHITGELWNHTSLSQAFSASITAAQSAQAPQTPSTTLATAQDILKQIRASSLIGWQGFAGSERDPYGSNWTFAAILGMVIGWLIVAGASLFGAPFWFDTLQKVTQLRGVGGGEGVQQRTGEKPAT